MLVYQRVVSINIPLNQSKIPLNHDKIPLNPASWGSPHGPPGPPVPSGPWTRPRGPPVQLRRSLRDEDAEEVVRDFSWQSLPTADAGRLALGDGGAVVGDGKTTHETSGKLGD